MIWDKIETPTDPEDTDSLKLLWNGLSNEKMIGVLHAFVLLKPTLQKTIKNVSKIEKAMVFMHKNGFQTHSKASIPNSKVTTLSQ